MNISYDHYRIFYYVAKYGSFTEAARRLLNSQPNVTRAMKTLETNLGCTLFNRTNKGVTLTPEGEILYAHISLAFEHIQTGETELSAGKDLQKGTVAIGATEISLRCFLLPILKAYRERYPRIRIRISNLSTPQALAALKDGLVDFAVVTTPTERSARLYEMNFREIKVKAFREIAVCGEALQRNLVGRDVEWKALTGYPIVSLERGSATHTFYAELFAEHDLIFSPDIEVATADQIIPIVRHDLGIGFIPEQFLRDEPKGLYPLRLTEPLPPREICVVTRKGQALGLAAKALERMMVGV